MMAYAPVPAAGFWPQLGHVRAAHSPNTSCSVKVINLPEDATESWIRALFCSIGRVVSVAREDNDGCATATVRFATTQQADCAFRFNGYMANGKCLHILPVSSSAGAVSTPSSLGTGPSPRGGECLSPNSRSRPTTASGRARATDAGPSHKNLYVLNLPLDVTTDQLAGLFGKYGTVIHCVILAMLDAQARRRGFIDMSQPSEAREAIESLNGFVWHGYPIEVSYAIVQRSGGPFDPAAAGRNVIKRNVPRNRFNTGPRRVPSDDSSLPTTPNAPMGIDYAGGFPISGFSPSPCPSSPGFSDGSGSSADVQGPDPRAVFITGLNADLISTDEAVRKAFQHLGEVSQAVVSRDEFGAPRGSGTVVFSTEEEAHRAVVALHGKIVEGRRIGAFELRAYGSSPHSQGDFNDLTGGYGRRGSVYSPIEPLSVDLAVHAPLDRNAFRNDLVGPSSWQRTLPLSSARVATPTGPPQELAVRAFEQTPASSPIPPSYFTPEAKFHGAGRSFGQEGFSYGHGHGHLHGHFHDGVGRGEVDWHGAFRPFGPEPTASATERTSSFGGAPHDSHAWSQHCRSFASDPFVPSLGGIALGPASVPAALIGPQDDASSWVRGSTIEARHLCDEPSTATIWTPPRREAAKQEDSPGCGGSVSSVDSSASILKTPDAFERLSKQSSNEWHMRPASPASVYQPHPTTGRSSRGDELREGSLPVAAGFAPDPVVGRASRSGNRKSLPPVGHEKVSLSPKSQDGKTVHDDTGKDADHPRLDLSALKLSDD